MISEQHFGGKYAVRGRGFADAGLVSSTVKKALLKRGIPDRLVRRAAVVTFEAEVNIISYAEKGTIKVQAGALEVVVEALDQGQGIADIELALQEGYSTADDEIREMGFGAGMGLSNIQKFSDEFHIFSEVGKGTYLKSVIRHRPGDGR